MVVHRLILICIFLQIVLRFADSQHLHLKLSQTTSSTAHNETTTVPTPSVDSSWKGYIGTFIAIIFFGSNFVPVKKFQTGDGLFFQWMLCVAIWFGGLITNCVQGFPRFYPLALLGGFMWTTGNICTVPIIKTIGLGLGMLIWGAFNLLSGWASGRFGWFGLTPQTPNNLLYNDLAIAFAMMSVVLWLFVKSDVSQGVVHNEIHDEAGQPLIQDDESKTPETLDVTWVDRLGPTQRRIVGCILSVFSGTLYGLSFAPVIYIKNNYKGASQTDIDYVFAHFCGILATSTFYFVIYCIIKKNKPDIYPAVILPAIVSGAMWAAADIGWFVANNFLSEAVSFPIITTGPGIIASLWGIFVFKEVTGRRNFIVMAFAYSATIVGAVLAGLSKV